MWTRGYFACSTGNVTDNMIKAYIDGHTEQNDNFKLADFESKLRSAFDDNLADYKHDIPQLFHCNAFCLLSNAIETKVGSFTAGWEYFFNWMRVDNEKEKVNRKAIAEQQSGVGGGRAMPA